MGFTSGCFIEKVVLAVACHIDNASHQVREIIMKRNKLLTFIVLALVGVGFIGPVAATPDESQRLRGLGGRVFAVNVYDVFAGVYFPNCYTFYEDGTWDDPLFPELGSWSQDSNGAKTSYTGTAYAEDLDIGAPFLINVLLEQAGMVTPAGGMGNLQLWAFTEVFSDELGGLIGQFESVGYEVDECP